MNCIKSSGLIKTFIKRGERKLVLLVGIDACTYIRLLKLWEFLFFCMGVRNLGIAFILIMYHFSFYSVPCCTSSRANRSWNCPWATKWKRWLRKWWWNGLNALGRGVCKPPRKPKTAKTKRLSGWRKPTRPKWKRWGKERPRECIVLLLDIPIMPSGLLCHFHMDILPHFQHPQCLYPYQQPV